MGKVLCIARGWGNLQISAKIDRFSPSVSLCLTTSPKGGKKISLKIKHMSHFMLFNL